MNKLKIINDPVYGFIKLPYEIIFDLMEHPYFQRLRRILQLGLTNLVYPGANHTRFHHALGAMHLMTRAIEVLRQKNVNITNEEAEAVAIAIFLHDIGHGPFSHALERSIIGGVSHEQLSLLFMEELNKQFDGKLDLAIEIFKGKYEKHFLHQLVSSQLDMDRMDYLTRDSFFTGVYEGVIGYDRIIQMLDVHNDNLVVEAKGIYSIEKFLVARRLMYWQVYLHKTVLVSELMLTNALKRAKELSQKGISVWATNALNYFLEIDNFENIDSKKLLDQFSLLDDYDIYASLKEWCNSDDFVLKTLSKGIIERSTFKIKMQNVPFDEKIIETEKKKVLQKLNHQSELKYLFYNNSTKNSAYNINVNNIFIKFKDGTLKDVAEASDQETLKQLSIPVKKHYLCFPKFRN